jgi:hypothetical protein
MDAKLLHEKNKRIVDRAAVERHKLHEKHKSHRPLSSDYEKIGLRGQLAFGELFNLMPDLKKKPKGDGGIHFILSNGWTVNVSTAEIPNHIIREHTKPFADVHVLARWDRHRDEAVLEGWVWGTDLQNAPVKDFGYGILNHHIPWGRLRKMDVLKNILGVD